MGDRPEWWLDYCDAAERGERIYFDFPRKAGKKQAAMFLLDHKLANGEHVHRVAADHNTYCEGGDPDCPLWGIQLREAMEVWQG